MRNLTKLLIRLSFTAGLLFCSICYGANDFSGDASCVAVWNLESGALTADSKGTNTLTNVGVDEDLVDFKQGACSGAFVRANSDRMYITDALLNSGFPLKSGETNKSFTILQWFYMDAADLNQYLTDKTAAIGNRSLINYIPSTNKVTLTISPDGTTWNYYTHASVLAAATWYFVAISYDGNGDDSYRIHINDVNGLVGSDLTGTASDIFIGTGAFQLGYGSTTLTFGGNMDEVVVFNRVLSVAEMDQVWAGTFGAPTGAPPQIF